MMMTRWAILCRRRRRPPPAFLISFGSRRRLMMNGPPCLHFAISPYIDARFAIIKHVRRLRYMSFIDSFLLLLLDEPGRRMFHAIPWFSTPACPPLPPALRIYDY